MKIRKMVKIHWLLLCVLFLFSCKSNEQDMEDQAKKQHLKDKNPVDTMILKKGVFEKELVSNGRLEALQKAKLRFNVSGELAKIFVSNGQRVKKGQLLARLDDFSLKNDLNKAQNQLEKAKVNFKDVLIGQGYEAEDTASVPNDFLRIAKVKSGLADAQTDLKEAKHRLKSASLYAPFSGVVANIEKKEYDKIGSGENFCTLIDNSKYHVNFSVLESELEEIKLNKAIITKPLAGGTFYGKIDQINPVVDENGLVTVRGLVNNTNGKLLEGMNAKVLVKTKVPGQLIIPKTAMVLRQNKEVVFTVKNDSIAMWNYVNTGLENSKSYTITKGLNPNEIVIISGNVNLAHESIVDVQ
jgi:RND family efflux transporter MFP subunit